MLQLIFLIVFPFALWKAWKNIQMAKASSSWPTVSGRVTTSECAKVMFRKQPRVTYSYAVNGAPLTGNRISFAGGHPPKETDTILKRYPVDREIVVSYAPDNPVEAALETGSNRQGHGATARFANPLRRDHPHERSQFLHETFERTAEAADPHLRGCGGCWS